METKEMLRLMGVARNRCVCKDLGWAEDHYGLFPRVIDRGTKATLKELFKHKLSGSQIMRILKEINESE